MSLQLLSTSWPCSSSARHTLQLRSILILPRTSPWSATSARIHSKWTLICLISCTSSARTSLVRGVLVNMPLDSFDSEEPHANFVGCSSCGGSLLTKDLLGRAAWLISLWSQCKLKHFMPFALVLTMITFFYSCDELGGISGFPIHLD